MPPRRIAAVVLPQLACEIARRRARTSSFGRDARPSGETSGPLAVILERPGESLAAELPATAILDVVDDEARRYGVRPGQRVTEASALASGLAIHRVGFDELEAALGAVAEVALALGTTAAIRMGVEGEARPDDGPFDTVWLDVTGAAHLVGGEEALIAELSERVQSLGHRMRAAIADGPRIAQAVARYGSVADVAVPVGQGAQAFGALSVRALPIDPDAASFLMRLGVITVDDLARLPRSAVTARLGGRAALALELVAGRDPSPLVAFAPPRTLEETASFEDGVESSEALLFVLRGMTSRVGARLAARGEACSRLEVTIPYDRSIARLRGTDDEALVFSVDLPAALSDPNDLLRALKAKLERSALRAPAVGLTLVVPMIARARRVQLDLSQSRGASPDALPALLAELSAEIGADRIGVLGVVDAHRPEARSILRALSKNDRPAKPLDRAPAYGPTRLLPAPIPLGRVTKGGVVVVDRQLYALESLRFVMRYDAVEWWTSAPASRDYARAWLDSSSSGRERSRAPFEDTKHRSVSGDAWIYIDRTTGEAFLQGWCE